MSLQRSSTRRPLRHRAAHEGLGHLLLPTPPQAEILGGSPPKMGIREEMHPKGSRTRWGGNLCSSPDCGFIALSFSPCGFGSRGVGLSLGTSGFKPWCCPKISVGHQESPLVQPGKKPFLLESAGLCIDHPQSRVLEHPIVYFRRCIA